MNLISLEVLEASLSGLRQGTLNSAGQYLPDWLHFNAYIFLSADNGNDAVLCIMNQPCVWLQVTGHIHQRPGPQ